MSSRFSKFDHPEVNPGTMPLEDAINLPNPLKELYFSRVVVGHQRMASVLDQLCEYCLGENAYDIVVLLGPSGIGKSCTLNALVKRTLKEYEDRMIQDPGMVPIIGIDVPEAGTRPFAYSTLYSDMLGQLHSPLPNRKVETAVVGDTIRIKPLNHGNSTVLAKQNALRQELKIRGTRVVILDESSHLIGHLQGQDLTNLANTFKSLSNVGGATLVLAGAYDMVKFLKLSGQLARRSKVIHFERYHLGASKQSAQDGCEFGNVILTFQENWPQANQPNFLGLAEGLHRACLGCVGILKQAFQVALNKTLANGGTLTDQILQESLLPSGALARLTEETLEGEEELRAYLAPTPIFPGGGANEFTLANQPSRPTSRKRSPMKPEGKGVA